MIFIFIIVYLVSEPTHFFWQHSKRLLNIAIVVLLYKKLLARVSRDGSWEICYVWSCAMCSHELKASKLGRLGIHEACGNVSCTYECQLLIM